MSRKTSTRWYIGAWVVWVIAWVAALLTGHTTLYRYGFLVHGNSPIGGAAVLVIAIATVVMLVVWIGALIRLGQLHSWGWFAAVFLLQVVYLGIVGMVAYAVAGPEGDLVMRRPTVT